MAEYLLYAVPGAFLLFAVYAGEGWVHAVRVAAMAFAIGGAGALLGEAGYLGEPWIDLEDVFKSMTADELVPHQAGWPGH